MHDADGPTRSERPRRRGAAVVVAIAVAAGALAAGGTPAGPVGAAAPARDVVDRQSPAVVEAASDALVRYRRFERRDTPRSLRRYKRARNAAAATTARALGADPDALRAAWAGAGRAHQVAVLAALTQLGVPYRRYTSEPGVGFDCSGLTSFAWLRAGYELSRSSGDQIDEAAQRRRRTAGAGDLVYYPGHVMLYLGVADAIVHSSNPDDDVELSYVAEGRSVRWGDPAP